MDNTNRPNRPKRTVLGALSPQQVRNRDNRNQGNDANRNQGNDANRNQGNDANTN